MIKQIKINETSKVIKSVWVYKRMIPDNIRTNCLKLIVKASVQSQQLLWGSHLDVIKTFVETKMDMRHLDVGFLKEKNKSNVSRKEIGTANGLRD